MGVGGWVGSRLWTRPAVDVGGHRRAWTRASDEAGRRQGRSRAWTAVRGRGRGRGRPWAWSAVGGRGRGQSRPWAWSAAGDEVGRGHGTAVGSVASPEQSCRACAPLPADPPPRVLRSPHRAPVRVRHTSCGDTAAAPRRGTSGSRTSPSTRPTTPPSRWPTP